MPIKGTDETSNYTLDPGFSVEFDNISRSEWTTIIRSFDDATFYQTWEYGLHYWGRNNLSHAILKKQNKIVAAAQLRIFMFPKISRGFAHVSWGPMWHRQNEEADHRTFRNMLRALKYHYAGERKLYLRLRLNEIHNTGNKVLKGILREEGFEFNKSQFQYRSMRLNLDNDLEDIRKNLRKKWRQYLNKSERQNFEIKEGTDQGLFEEVCLVHDNMVIRKKYSRYVANTSVLRRIQRDLPESVKLRVILGLHKNEIAGAIAFCQLGKTAMPVLSAITEKSIESKLYVSYLLHWRMIVRLKEYGYDYLDLRGYSPESYHGPSFFKEGLKGEDIRFMGSYEAVDSKLSLIVVRLGEWLDVTTQNMKSMIKDIAQKLIVYL